MREIKFRAWALGRNGTMQLMYSRDEPNLSQYFSWTDDFEQQQYTGLKDKNGVEIYEGDIIHWSIDHEDSELVEINQGNFAVKWMPWGWVLDYPNGVPLPSASSGLWRLIDDAEEDRNNFEIVGNIYENPELLEGSK